MESVRDAYDTFAEHWDHTRQHNWYEFEFLKDHIPAGARVLDLGCGNGRLYEYLKESVDCHYVGIDISKELVNIAKQKYPEGKFQLGDALKLPFKDRSFDFVASFAVAHHIAGHENRKQFFAEVARILKPNRHAFITVWNLFQPKYKQYLSEHFWQRLWNVIRSPINTPFGFADAFIPFGQEKTLRYVHAYTPDEMEALSMKHFRIKKEMFTKKGERVQKYPDAFNFCYYLEKR